MTTAAMPGPSIGGRDSPQPSVDGHDQPPAPALTVATAFSPNVDGRDQPPSPSASSRDSSQPQHWRLQWVPPFPASVATAATPIDDHGYFVADHHHHHPQLLRPRRWPPPAPSIHPQSQRTNTVTYHSVLSDHRQQALFQGRRSICRPPNSLDQFCIDFANERLHHFIHRRLFESHVDECKSEGMPLLVSSISYFDNSECICLLQNKPGGLIHIVDDLARRSHKKTDHTMTEAFGKRWGHSSWVRDVYGQLL